MGKKGYRRFLNVAEGLWEAIKINGNVKVLERDYVVLVMEGIRHGDAILVDIRRKRIFLYVLYFSPYMIPPEFGILKE